MEGKILKPICTSRESRILALENPESATPFLWLPAQYPSTWFGLGNFEKGAKSYSNWILKNPVTNEFSIWRTNHWHHICIAYNQYESRISFIKVIKIPKIRK